MKKNHFEQYFCNLIKFYIMNCKDNEGFNVFKTLDITIS